MPLNAFILPQKIFLFSRYLNFCLDVWPYRKQLDQKGKINFKFYDVTAWLTIAIYIFLENHTQNVVDKLVPDTFLEN